jgi:hypothetical protein
MEDSKRYLTMEEALEAYSPVRTFERLADTGWYHNEHVPITGDRQAAEEPQLPENLSEYPLHSLRQLQAEFAVWLSYVANQWTKTLVEKRHLEKQLQTVQDRLFISLPGKQRDKFIAIRADRDFVTLDSQLLQHTNMLDILSSRMEILRESLKAISRQMTVLMADMEAHGLKEE